MSSIKKRTTGKFVNYSVPLLGTIEDIKRRKTAISSNIFSKNKRITQISKIQALKTHIQSTFFYNCKIWTRNKSGKEKIDQFQRI